jgi:hypothetical protein
MIRRRAAADAFDAADSTTYGRSMSNGSNYLDPDRPKAVRLSVGNARALGEAALVRIGYGADDACIITSPTS